MPQISRQIVAILHEPELRERLVNMGSDPCSGTPEELRNILARDLARWGKLVRDANIRAE